jgi:hypothetical protein
MSITSFRRSAIISGATLLSWPAVGLRLIGLNDPDIDAGAFLPSFLLVDAHDRDLDHLHIAAVSLYSGVHPPVRKAAFRQG